MDDLELEARLRTRLRARFDAAQPPPELALIVRQSMATVPGRVTLGSRRVRPLQLSWLVAAVVVAAVAIANLDGGRSNVPGAVTPTPGPSSTPVIATTRTFVVVPAAGSNSSKPDSIAASDVLSARLRALGFGTFTSSGDYGIEFALPLDVATDDAVRFVLSSTGDLSFVPLPAADYGEGSVSAEVGKPLPKDEPALFGRDGIESISFDVDQEDRTVIAIALRPAAQLAFGDYTAAHIGEYFAIVLDGRVALLPIINAPIPGGQVSISPGVDDQTFPVTAAILIGGVLPDSWRGASVPTLVTRADAVTNALFAVGGGTAQGATESVEQAAAGDALRVVWNVEILQSECSDTGSCVGDLLVKVDAVTGYVIHVGAFEP